MPSKVTLSFESLNSLEGKMSGCIRWLLNQKPNFFPKWLYMSLLVCGVLGVLYGLALGMWFVSTEVEFL